MKLLVCGFGSIGRRHLANARSLRHGLDVAVLEPDRALWTDGARFAGALDDVAGDFDVAMICSPTATHAEQIAALAGRARALFIEKPLAHDRAALAAIRAAVAGRPIISMVGCNYRFEPGLLRVRELLASGAIGKPLSFRAEFGHWLPSWRPTTDYRRGYAARRETGGGIILDRIHELDYATWLFGTPAKLLAMSDRLGPLEIETEDVAEILLRFESGVIGSIHGDYLQREYVCKLDVIGERGTVEWRFKPTRVRVLGEAGVWQTVHDDAQPDVNAMYVAELAHFFDALDHGRPPANGLAEAARTLELALTALEQR